MSEIQAKDVTLSIFNPIFSTKKLELKFFNNNNRNN